MRLGMCRLGQSAQHHTHANRAMEMELFGQSRKSKMTSSRKHPHNVIELSFNAPNDVWACICGCPLFWLHRNGAAECSECNLISEEAACQFDPAVDYGHVEIEGRDAQTEQTLKGREMIPELDI